jgi:hypothetical protein
MHSSHRLGHKLTDIFAYEMRDEIAWTKNCTHHTDWPCVRQNLRSVEIEQARVIPLYFSLVSQYHQSKKNPIATSL